MKMKRIIYLGTIIVVPCFSMQSDALLPKKLTYEPINKVVIIGSGVAGLTAALYCAREQLEPLVIEGEEAGGMLVNAGPIENWPGQFSTIGPDLVGKIRRQAEEYGAHFIAETVTKVDFQNRPFTLWTSAGHEIKTHAVIAATGSLPRKLHCPGEKEYWGNGVAICVLCDGPMFAHKTIVVAGGGDLALDKAFFLTRYASQVIIVHRKEQLTASPYMQHLIAQSPKISTVPHATISEIKGDGEHVTSVILEDQKTKTKTELPTDGVFLAIGFNPCSEVFKGELELTEEGYIAISHFTQTSVPGVFAAGNVAGHGYRPAITAAGTGCMAGIDAETYLTNMFSERIHKHQFCSHKAQYKKIDVTHEPA